MMMERRKQKQILEWRAETVLTKAAARSERRGHRERRVEFKPVDFEAMKEAFTKISKVMRKCKFKNEMTFFIQAKLLSALKGPRRPSCAIKPFMRTQSKTYETKIEDMSRYFQLSVFLQKFEKRRARKNMMLGFQRTFQCSSLRYYTKANCYSGQKLPSYLSKDLFERPKLTSSTWNLNQRSRDDQVESSKRTLEGTSRETESNFQLTKWFYKKRAATLLKVLDRIESNNKIMSKQAFIWLKNWNHLHKLRLEKYSMMIVLSLHKLFKSRLQEPFRSIKLYKPDLLLLNKSKYLTRSDRQKKPLNLASLTRKKIGNSEPVQKAFIKYILSDLSKSNMKLFSDGKGEKSSKGTHASQSVEVEESGMSVRKVKLLAIYFASYKLQNILRKQLIQGFKSISMKATVETCKEYYTCWNKLKLQAIIGNQRQSKSADKASHTYSVTKESAGSSNKTSLFGKSKKDLNLQSSKSTEHLHKKKDSEFSLGSHIDIATEIGFNEAKSKFRRNNSNTSISKRAKLSISTNPCPSNNESKVRERRNSKRSQLNELFSDRKHSHSRVSSSEKSSSKVDIRQNSRQGSLNTSLSRVFKLFEHKPHHKIPEGSLLRDTVTSPKRASAVGKAQIQPFLKKKSQAMTKAHPDTKLPDSTRKSANRSSAQKELETLFRANSRDNLPRSPRAEVISRDKGTVNKALYSLSKMDTIRGSKNYPIEKSSKAGSTSMVGKGQYFWK